MDVKRRIRIRKLIRRCVVLAAIVGVVLVEYDRNDKRWDKLDKILKLFPDAEEQETEVMLTGESFYGQNKD